MSFGTILIYSGYIIIAAGLLIGSLMVHHGKKINQEISEEKVIYHGKNAKDEIISELTEQKDILGEAKTDRQKKHEELAEKIEQNSPSVNVTSINQSGGITAGKVDIEVNPEKPKLVLSKEKTKVQVTDGIYEKKFYFRNPDGRTLQQIFLKVTFDKEFTLVKGDKWVWTGMIARGSEKTQPEPGSKSMVFFTEVLEPVAFIEITVTSKYDIKIEGVEFKTL